MRSIHGATLDVRIAIITKLAAGWTHDETYPVAARPRGLTMAQLQSIALEYGYPDRDKLTASLARLREQRVERHTILERPADPPPAKKTRAPRPPVVCATAPPTTARPPPLTVADVWAWQDAKITRCGQCGAWRYDTNPCKTGEIQPAADGAA